MADDSDYATLKMEIIPIKADQVRETYMEGMREFMGIWERLGVSNTKCLSRIDDMVKHYTKLNEFMVKEERETEEQILDELTKYEEQMILLCAELSLDQRLYEPDRSLKILALHEAVREQVLHLSEIKDQRMSRLKTLRQEESPLSRRLCVPSHPKFDGAVPSDKYLHELEENVKWLRKEEVSKRDTFLTTRKEIIMILADIEAVPTNTFERQVVLEPEQEFLLSSKNMESLKIYKSNVKKQQIKDKDLTSNMMRKVIALWDRLSISEPEQNLFHDNLSGTTKHKLQMLEKEIIRCETLRRENIGKYIARLRSEIGSLQDQCHLSEEERSHFRAMFSDDYTEELLDQHEVEAERLKEFYERIKGIVSLVENHKTKFERFVELDKRENDPDRLKKRRGSLQKELQMHMKLKNCFVGLEKEIATRVAQWEASNGGRKFLLDGVDVVEAIEQQWTDYYNEKENEKLEKKRAKAQQLEDEALNGTKPLVPNLKRAASNVSKTPSKMRKFGNTTNTPMSFRTPLHSTANRTNIFRTPASTSTSLRSTPFMSKVAKTAPAPARSSARNSNKGINGSVVSRRKSGAGKASALLKSQRSKNDNGSPSSTLGTTLSSYDEFTENINRKAEREQCRSSVLVPKSGTLKFSAAKIPKGRPFL